MAAPVYSSAGAGATTEASGAAHNVPVPATVAAGDLLVIHLMYEGSTIAPTAPGGWTLIDPSGPRTGVSGLMRTWVYGRISDGSEGGTNINFGSPANANARTGRCYRFTGVRNDTVSNVVGGFNAETLNQTGINDVGVTTPEADCLAVNLVGVQDDNPVVSFTGETGGDWTEAVAEYAQSATTPDTCLQLQTATMSAAGTVNGGTQTMAAADPWIVVGFYIRGVSGTAWTQPVDDTLSLSDAQALDRGEVIPDTLSLSDAQAFVGTFERTIPDTVTPSDALALARDIHVDDSVSMSDLATPQSGKSAAVDDSVSLSDAQALDRGLTIADSVSMSDAQAFAREIHVADSVTMSDALAFAGEIHLADSVSMSDLCDPVKETGGGAETQNVDDSVSVSDLVATAAAFARQVDDSVAMSDLVTAEQGKSATVSDSVTISDSVSFLVGRGLVIDDSVTLSDLVTFAAVLERTIDDSVSISDTIDVLVTSPYLPPVPGFIDFPGIGLITRPAGGVAAGADRGRVAAGAVGRLAHTGTGGVT